MKSFARWTVLLLSLGVAGYGLYAYLALSPGTTVHPAICLVVTDKVDALERDGALDWLRWSST